MLRFVETTVIRQATSSEMPYHNAAYRAAYFAREACCERVPIEQGKQQHCIIIKDIFGNPFRFVPLESSWLNHNVTKIGQIIYDQRRFEDMSILGDALEDAGCTNDEILDHCRRDGPHAKGCWVIDLLLAKK